MSTIGKIDRIYHCFECGHSWSAKPIWAKWPPSFKWFWHGWRDMFKRGIHGYEVGCKNFGQRVYATVIRIGPLRIILGANYKSPIVYHAGKWLSREMDERLDPFDRELAEMGTF